MEIEPRQEEGNGSLVLFCMQALPCIWESQTIAHFEADFNDF